MSLRDKNNQLTPTGKPGEAGAKPGGLAGSLRQAATKTAISTTPDPRVTAALQAVTAKHGVAIGNGRVGLFFDATASRASDWGKKKEIQEQMFREIQGVGNMTLRPMHFGGHGLADHGWLNDPQIIAVKMREVECVTGSTQFIPGLEKFVTNNPREAAASIILIGDAYEEGNVREALGPVIEKLAKQGTKIFTFLEGDNPTAKEAFQFMAEKTGGKFAPFGDLSLLRDLCVGVALMSIGGNAALQRLQNQEAQLLLTKG
ncbi:MAG TPA: VWA domain-containing protein [Alphaproteobacteria bacterium]|nr:VWA domain-containing protein [Alphaproteobacteria bacterium]